LEQRRVVNQPERSIMAVVVHEGSDDAYLEWMRLHPEGFVLNVKRSEVDRTGTIHRSGCAHIRVLRNSNTAEGFTKGGVFKICANTLHELLTHMSLHKVGASLKVIRCRSCEPSPADLSIDRLAEEVGPAWHASRHVLPISINAYEQDPLARLLCLRAHGSVCKVCSIDLERIYGRLGIAAMHVHFLPPLERLGPDHMLDPVRDLIPVCPTCHTMLHRGREEALRIEDLKAIMEQARTRWHEQLMREY
jgi:hypothetical protein